jgi:NAD(P)-dependent dehydrogenase (short-subunit alcohol dehydrogenase family)
MIQYRDWDIRDRVCIVTGGNAGLGRATATELARRGAQVFLAGRSRERNESAVAEIKVATGNPRVDWLALDLASLESVHACADSFLAKGLPLHILINNAGRSGCGGLTDDGFELVFGTNHIGHFLLTIRLINRMLESAPGRIVNVTSLSHRKLKSVDWSIANRPTPTTFTWPHPTYPVSKLANILFTKELARRLAGTGITTYAAHPGVVATDIWRVVPPRLQPVLKLLKPMMATSEQGARTQIRCAVAPELAKETGLFYSNEELRTPSALGQDAALAAELWRLSEGWCGCRAPI